MSEWKEVKVSELGKVVTGKTPRTSNPGNYGGEIPFLTPSDDMSVKYSKTTVKTLTVEGMNTVKNSLIPKDSVVVSCIGSDLGKVIITTRDTVTNQQMNSIVVNKDKYDVDFIYYSMVILGRLMNFHSKTSTAIPIVNKSTFSEYTIMCPELNEQKRIASVLAVIDEKIENNNLINKNLEQQMQTYFDELFVVNANPSWPNISLSEIGTIVAGGTPSKAESTYYTDNGIAWITPKDLSVNKSKFISHGEIDITDLGFSKSSATKMPAGTVLFSSRAPIGYIAIAQNELTTNQGFKSIVPNKQVGTAYVYFLLKHLLPTIEGMASGSTFKEISGAGMKSVPTFMPDDKTIKIFSDFCTPIFKQQENLEAEISSLTAIRDALIPKLMSGELDISQMDI